MNSITITTLRVKNMQSKIIDVHCHVLPRIDDGPDSLQESVEMVKLAVQHGVKAIIATPHYIPGELEYEVQEIHNRVSLLQSALNDSGIDCTIYPGMELYLSPKIIENISQGRVVPLGGIGNYLLVEFPSRDASPTLINLIYEIRLRGFQPIIAHPERNEMILKDPLIVNRLLQEGALLQLNAGSLIGKYGNKVKNLAEDLIKQELISLVGSDAHSVQKRSFYFDQVLECFKGKKMEVYAQDIFHQNGNKILTQQEIIRPSSLFKKRMGFFRF